MNKKFLSLVLALVMVLGTFGNVFAAAATDKKEVKDVPKLTSTDAKVQWLIDNAIVVGTADKDGKATGNKDLTSPIRRDAAAKMLVYAVGAQDLAAKLQGVYRPFPDVETSNIMNGLIAAAASSNNANGVAIITGYEDGLFRPTKNVTYAELAKMLVVAIDKDLTPAKAKTYSWPQGWMDRAVQLGIFDGLSVDKANDPAVRRDAFAMVYNAFYKMKELKAVPMNEFRGVISEQSNGTKVVLNQGEFKKEFKVNENTVFVKVAKKSPKMWLKNFNSEYYVGSLVRVLFDKDGVATHIIEMGNPQDLAVNEPEAWVDLGKIQLKTAESKDPATVKLADKEIEFVRGAKFAVTSKTVFYIADAKNGVLTQVKDYAAAKDLVEEETKDVYVGYEYLNQSKTNEAKVVVFNHAKVDKSMRNVRVAQAPSNDMYKLFVQAPGATATKLEDFSERTNDKRWPYNYGYEADDVLGVAANGDLTMKIDASNAGKFPVVKVNKLVKYENGKAKEVATLAEANAIELVDKTNMAATYDLPTDFDAFFGNGIVKGAKVQFLLDGLKIDILSVVNRAEKGTLTAGELYDTRVKTGVVEKINVQEGLIPRIFIRVEGEGLLEYVTTDTEFKVGDLVDYRVTGFNKNDTKPEVVLDKVVKTAKEIADANAAAVTKNLPKDTDVTDDKYDAKKAPDLKKAIDEAKAMYAKLPEETQVEKDAKKDAMTKLNDVIKAYNNLKAAANAKADEVK